TPEELEAIERKAKRAVWENLEVQVLYPSEDELEQMEYRRKIEIEGQVRIVVIPGYDVCACCAPHVERTGEIGLIKPTGPQRYNGGGRVARRCGARALADYDASDKQAGGLAALRCGNRNERADGVRHLR